MDIRRFTLLLSYILTVIFNESSSQNISEYIEEKSRSTKVKIVRSYIENVENTMPYIIQWNKLASKVVRTDQTLSLDIFNEIFVIMKNEEIISMSVMKIDTKEIKSNNPVDVYQHSLIQHARSVKFIKKIVWNDSLFLLICYEENFCSIYTSESNFNLYHRQNIKSNGQSVAAIFITKDDHLFLIIANNFGPYPVDSAIYMWNGVYMVEVVKMTMNSVHCLTAFNNNRGGIIIIFGRKENQQWNIESEVYEIFMPDENNSGSIRRIQFLPTSKLVSLHHYTNHGLDFLLVIDEIKPAHIYLWERNEFLSWHEVDEIFGNSILLRKFDITNNPVILIAKMNILSLYNVTSESYNLLKNIAIENVVKIIDLEIWNDDQGNIFLASITERVDNSYGIELWQLTLDVRPQVECDHNKIMNKTKINEKVNLCLGNIEELLKERMSSIEKIHESWKLLTSSANIDTLNFSLSIDNSTKMLIKKLKDSINNINKDVDDLLEKSHKLIHHKANENSTGILVLPSLVINGSAQFQSLKTPLLFTKSLNGMKLNNVTSKHTFTNESQHFSNSLRGRHVKIHDLKVKSLCGISQEHWLLKNDSSRMPLKPVNQKINESLIKIINNTVIINTNINFPNIHLETLNTIDLPNIIHDLFIIGQSKIINGNLCYQQMLSINNLTVSGYLNGIAKNDVITLTTNQNFTAPIKFDSLEVSHLIVNKVNGVPIEDAARVSRENIIRSKVIINHLKVRDEFIVEDPTAFANKEYQMYIYDDVEIIGDVMIDNLIVEPQVNITLNSSQTGKGSDVNDLFEKSWTKSTNQIISSPIINFQRGLTIDKLNTKYFNGLQEHEYLYITAEYFPAKFGKIHFTNLIANGSIYRGENNNKKLFYFMDDSVIINRQIHIPFLTVRQLHTNRYNGIPIDDLMKNKISADQSQILVLPHDVKFSNLIINEKLDVDQLQLQRFKGDKMPEKLVNNGQSIIKNHLQKNNKNFSAISDCSVNYNSTLEDFFNASEIDITINGELIIDEELKVDGVINDEDVDEYINRLAKSDISINNEIFIDNLTVHDDSTIEFLNGINFNEFVSNIFSKSKDQEINWYSIHFNEVISKNLRATKINGFTLDQFHFINDSMIFENNVTFTRLSANIKTDQLNGIKISNIITNISTNNNASSFIKSITKLNSLKVNGNIYWIKNNLSSLQSDGLFSLLKNAITKHDSQTINGLLRFSSNESEVHVDSLVSSINIFNPNIDEILEDSVINTPNSTVMITGKKNFLNSITIGDLEVNNDIKINQLETMTVKELNDSLVRKFDDEIIIDNDCTIIGETINISHLIVPNLGPDMPNISTLFVISDNATNNLPTNTHFEELIVHGNATVEYFDDVLFDKFINERVSIRGNHTIYSSVRFTKPVVVTEKTQIENCINNVTIENLVINGTIEKQVINSKRSVFFEELSVNGGINISFLNGIDILKKYEEGVFSDEPSIIESDLYIGSDMNLSSQLITTGFINDFNISEMINDWDTTVNNDVYQINGNYTEILKLINNNISADSSNNLPQLFNHLEMDESFAMKNFPNVSQIISEPMDNYTEFNIYGRQLGRYCSGLPDNCPCRTQYVVELGSSNINNNIIKHMDNGQWIIYTYHDPNKLFQVNVKTNTTSSSPQCSLSKNQIINEHTLISLRILYPTKHASEINFPLRINGYLSDVKIFVNDKNIYIVLAIGYDNIRETYQADSFIYKLNLDTYELVLNFVVPMNSASMVEVFTIKDKNSYVFICSSFGESLLYKLDPVKYEFIFIRSFAAGGTIRHVKSLSYDYHSDYFLLLDDSQSNAVHVYCYNEKFDNFYFYQSLHHESSVVNIEVFYIGKFKNMDAFLVVITEAEVLYLYEYMIYEKFKLRIKKEINGLQAVSPFNHSNRQYLLLMNSENTALVRIVNHGSLQ
ncbi:hypothetical protein PV327_008344 [Microctonus hyperodae]|uniref:Uncharacterized protein n=1 Tax=Microctonus hyperodae TaxID=165561 RepID=A0AA39KH18_MICHY|nr:hypothetical protein PV327_008344 [Microctonus hyperodae]